MTRDDLDFLARVTEEFRQGHGLTGHRKQPLAAAASTLFQQLVSMLKALPPAQRTEPKMRAMGARYVELRCETLRASSRELDRIEAALMAQLISSTEFLQRLFVAVKA